MQRQDAGSHLTEYQSEQIETVRAIHQQLMEHIGHRMERAAKLLQETDLSIAEIAEQVGYESQSRFSTAFKEYSGTLPKSYRNTFALQKHSAKSKNCL